MKSEDLTIEDLFSERRQFLVPFYQRSYVWNRSDQWEQLWDDIRQKTETRLSGNEPSKHFLGAVVLDPQTRSGLRGVETYHIIDGQQRLTTLQFILKSILLLLKNLSLDDFIEIVSLKLNNSNPETMNDPEVEKYKVWPTFKDRSDYKKTINVNVKNDLIPIFPNSFTQRGTLKRRSRLHPKPLECIWYFNEIFEEWVNQDDHFRTRTRCENLILSILKDFKVVTITLDKDDDAQVIFETLNGRGAQLYSTDLIRNFIFMRSDSEGGNSETLYNDYWKLFEDQYWSRELTRGRRKKPILEWFIHTTLQSELCEDIDLGRLYFEYRRYVLNPSNPKSAENQLIILTKNSKQYKDLIDGNNQTSIGRFGSKILPFEITTIHPIALHIGKSDLPDIEKEKVFKNLLSYIVRRNICGLTTKNYNNIFNLLLKNLSKNTLSNEFIINYLKSLVGVSRWPRNEELKLTFLEQSVYPGSLELSKKVKYVLSEIEQEIRKNQRTEDLFFDTLDNLDIDHIMPRSWYQYWNLPDGSSVDHNLIYYAKQKKLIGQELNQIESDILKREAHIFTIGNLTLLNNSLNREAKHREFSHKKELIFKNTNLRINISLLNIDDWNEFEIRNRSETFFNYAKIIWPYPSEQG